MTPEEEAQFKAMQAELTALKQSPKVSKEIDPAVMAKLDSALSKLDRIEKQEAAKEAANLFALKEQFSKLANVKLDSLNDWTAEELTRSIKLEEDKAKYDSAAPSDDALIPKLDGKGQVIPPYMRVNWTKANYPDWSS